MEFALGCACCMGIGGEVDSIVFVLFARSLEQGGEQGGLAYLSSTCG